MDSETISTIIPAISALAGVFLAQAGAMIHKSFDRNAQRASLRREKLEELADQAFQTMAWGDHLINSLPTVPPRRASVEKDPQPAQLSAQARRVYVLSLLYFPELQCESRRLMKASNNLHLLSADAKDIDVEKMQAAAIEFGAALKALDSLISQAAKKIT